MNIDFEALRAANIQRQAEWTGNENLDLLFRALEVADEVGEVAGAVKKYIRAQRGVCGSVAALGDVADEIGDAVISLDLLAIELGASLPVGQFVKIQNVVDPIRSALALDVAGGAISDAALLLDHVPEGSEAELFARTDLRDAVTRTLGSIATLSDALHIDARAAVSEKFNKTSVKYGLATRMEAA
ncbi:MazG-like family protein [Ruegeria marisrubri]|uniref:MazG-like family protein n=1 Tax=Ruegeria marisrubri TaxID=1685379 RepID=UPI001CD5A096|nr:MazG-like family protein [Ruegeria marisrubri]MCA0905146.1 MazG-like family protein [Ruegeria marisrubri]